MHKDFWKEAEESQGRDQDTATWDKERDKENFQRKVFDEFDDFFDFSSDQGYDPLRDDTKGADYKTDLNIEFLDAVNGADLKIDLDKRIKCDQCNGRRTDVTKQTPRRCFECGGSGTFIGNYGIRKKCPKCDGAGCKVKSFCGACEGLGIQRLQV